MIGVLPEALNINGTYYPIRTDYRNILRVFEAFEDSELLCEEKWIVSIYMIFEDFFCADDVLNATQNGFDLDEAIKKILWFISAGQPEKENIELPVYSWKQDQQMIFSPINKVAGKETRELEYLHWWTFLGYFNEIGEGTFSFVVGIRDKLNKKKKLEKNEKKFINNNKALVILKKRESKEELEQKKQYNALMDRMLT